MPILFSFFFLPHRAAFVNLGDLTTYDSAKHLILKHTSLKDNYFTHALSSACSGFVAGRKFAVWLFVDHFVNPSLSLPD